MMRYLDSLGGRVSTLLFLVTVLDRIIPHQVKNSIGRFYDNLLNYFNPCVVITFEEYPPESYGRSKAYDAIQHYLGAKLCLQAERLKGNMARDRRSLALTMDDFQEVNDVYEGVGVSWVRTKELPKAKVISNGGGSSIEIRAYVLSFRRKDRDLVIGPYLGHVISEGKMIKKQSRGQRIYNNVSEDNDQMGWNCAEFEHPATFDTLAMDPKMKKDIMDDLVKFTKSKEYYKKIGKPWRRGYLLYGPPGTGKSTMIAAIANFLHFDVYDLELTAVTSNTALRNLMIDISKRAIVVIEDIDCSLEITGKRRSKSDGNKDDNEKKKSKITLSGLLNFMDGLWSASGGERIFIITTNFKQKLDQALLRTGRMDRHIHMSYCCYEAFKVLANNYLALESHHKFDDIRCLLSEIEISPADVAEHLMPKSAEMSADECLESLIAALMLKSKNEAEKIQDNSESDMDTNTNTNTNTDADTDTDTDTEAEASIDTA